MIMLVDDDQVFVRLLAANLEAAGYATRVYTDPQQALAELGWAPAPAVCVLDWQMPHMDGLAFFNVLRARNQTMPVIFLTGHGTTIFEEAALAAGAVDFVDKARGPSIILHRLALALARSAPTAEAGEPHEVMVGCLLLRRQSKRAVWRGKEVSLSRGEFDVVELLALQRGADVSYRALYDALRGKGFMAGKGEEGYRANVRAMIKRIRRKFTNIDPQFDALATYAGFGYRWRGEDQ